MFLKYLSFLSLFASCTKENSRPDTSTNFPANHDEDGDGYYTPDDCNDMDSEVHPGSPFTCVWSALPTCTMGQEEIFTETTMSPPEWGSNSYRVPPESARTHLLASIQAALAGDAAGAIQAATLAEYHLCAEDSVLLWSAPSGSGGAALALRTHPSAIDIIIETPHSFFDLGTLEEGLLVFQRTQARALLASGTHRCAADTISECSGETQVCTLFSSEPFRLSDMAHTDTSFFHAAHIALADGLPQTVIIQLHMFLEAGASVSNGKTSDITNDDPSARLTETLTTALPDQKITSCNDYGAGNTEQRICGTSNTQGRYLNGSSDACGEGAPSASGRFIHLEQNITVIEQANMVAQAIMSAFGPQNNSE